VRGDEWRARKEDKASRNGLNGTAARTIADSGPTDAYQCQLLAILLRVVVTGLQLSKSEWISWINSGMCRLHNAEFEELCAFSVGATAAQLISGLELGKRALAGSLTKGKPKITSRRDLFTHYHQPCVTCVTKFSKFFTGCQAPSLR